MSYLPQWRHQRLQIEVSSKAFLGEELSLWTGRTSVSTECLLVLHKEFSKPQSAIKYMFAFEYLMQLCFKYVVFISHTNQASELNVSYIFVLLLLHIYLYVSI